MSLIFELKLNVDCVARRGNEFFPVVGVARFVLVAAACKASAKPACCCFLQIPWQPCVPVFTSLVEFESMFPTFCVETYQFVLLKRFMRIAGPGVPFRKVVCTHHFGQLLLVFFIERNPTKLGSFAPPPDSRKSTSSSLCCN